MKMVSTNGKLRGIVENKNNISLDGNPVPNAVLSLFNNFYDKYHINYVAIVDCSKVYYKFDMKDIFHLSFFNFAIPKKRLHKHYYLLEEIIKLMSDIAKETNH